MTYSKKAKLPKAQWVKGRSKFVHLRLMEDAARQRLLAGVNLVKKVSRLKKMYYAILRVFAKIKKRRKAAGR
jgi:hypothetical protein